MTISYPYNGEDFCITHGREHMRSQMGNPFSFCQACEAFNEVVRDAWTDLVEKDDRTSPEEYPDMALITREELREFMERAAQIQL